MEAKFMGRKINALIAYTLACTLMLLLNRSHSSTLDTLHLGDSLTAERTITSNNGMFELGLFCISETSYQCYIGIWYANTTERMIVWVGNREAPISRFGCLIVTRDGYLGLFENGYYMDPPVWSPDVRKKASYAVIQDSGNFVLLGGHDNLPEIIWQSFDHPGDSWLPGMKLRRGQNLLPWKNSYNPAPGPFSFQMDPSGAQKFVLSWKNSVPYWKRQFTDFGKFGLGVQLEDSSSDSFLTYDSSIYPFMRLVINMNGILRTDYYTNFSWQPGESNLGNQCDVYNLCGDYGVCRGNVPHSCSCLDGFFSSEVNIDVLTAVSTGCERLTPLNCSTDEFVKYKVWMPDNDGYSYPARTRKRCETTCLRNCNCTAFRYIPPTGHCKIYVGELRNLQYLFNSSLFVRVAADSIPVFASVPSPYSPDPPPSSALETTPIVVWELLPVLVGGVFAVLVIYLVIKKRKWRRPSVSTVGGDDSPTDSTSVRMFSYMELKTATGNFKHKLGSGGFGSVYKGTLTDITLVAVKKLEGSKIADKQFRAEIRSVGNINHVNLIRLKGFCADGSRRLLVYECMPNGSLNSFLFNVRNSESQGKTLDWKTRFGIALGIARALRYLHDECRDRIIHGDVKPENVLLDADFSPKLGDFGLAKLFDREFSHVLTTTRGTRGYLAPEWISGLPITPKVDVYSFGMTLLEIISGRRNLDLSVQESSMYYFPAWAATEIEQGKMMNIVDKRIVDSACVDEVRRATLVSLLCIQNEENARPSMGEVVLMLEGTTEAHEVPVQVPTQLEDHEIDAGSSDSY